jgi:antitoxin HigA-1
MRKVLYPHPGEILLEEFLKPTGITQYRLAKEIGVPQRLIGEIAASTRSVTPDTGLRLSRFFGMSENFWTGQLIMMLPRQKIPSAYRLNK